MWGGKKILAAFRGQSVFPNIGSTLDVSAWHGRTLIRRMPACGLLALATAMRPPASRCMLGRLPRPCSISIMAIMHDVRPGLIAA